ncbi:MAG: orotidine-5'-phosphate decarboxylase, partial [Candidatus Woesearchaeota archaeon]
MDFVMKLRNSAKENNSIVCMGMDPVLEKIPVKGKPGKVIEKFFSDILDAIVSENTRPGIVKPNYPFYAMYGFPGLRALKKVIRLYKKQKFLVILDSKRNDIGNTSAAYAKEIFEFWKADAVTVAPYMGSDSVLPFVEYCSKGKGVYVLNRTSNPGASDFQNLESNGIPLYMHVSNKIIEWHKQGIGAVVGATYPKELEQISSHFVNSGKEVQFLIPGVGTQGGSAAEVAEVLRKTNNELFLHRINSSSGISYAYEKEGTDDYAGAAVRAIRKLNQEINLKAL